MSEDIQEMNIKIDIKQVPSIIQEQFDNLYELNENVIEAIAKAELAQESALEARDTSAGAFKKKAAIESLQSAVVDLADAQISSVSAQQVAFEYQQKVGEIMKFLLGLGVSNIAMNRSVVRELELKLKGASEDELDEFARQEILSVVKQLKAQQDIMKKQDNLSQIVKEHDATIKSYGDHEKDQDEILKKQALKDKEHDKKLQEKSEKDKKQDAELETRAQKDAEHDELILKLEEKCNKLGEDLSACKEEVAILKESEASKNQLKWNILAITIAGVALVLSIINILM